MMTGSNLFFFLIALLCSFAGAAQQSAAPGKPHSGIYTKPKPVPIQPGKPLNGAQNASRPKPRPVQPGKPFSGMAMPAAKPKPQPIQAGKPLPYPGPVLPRPPGSGIRPDCVGPGNRWVPGRWVYNPRTGQQVWIDGYCISRKGDSIWIEGHYVETPMGLRWVPGRWIHRGYPQYKGKR